MRNQVNNAFDKIDQRVVAVALFVSVIEFETFTFVKGVVGIAQQDAWMAVLLGGLIAAMTTFLMVKLASRFPKESYFEYSKRIWGRPISFIILVSYLFYWMLYVVLLFEDTVYANKFYFLKETPSIVTLLFLAVGAAWLVSYGMTVILRFFYIMFPFMAIPLLLVFAIGIRNVDISHFQPVFKGGVMPIIKGALYFAGALQGLEIILFLSPFLKDVKKATKPAMFGIGLIIMLTFLQMVLAIGIMGVNNIKYSIFPGIDTISLMEFPGFAVERFELFLTFPWLIGVFTTICIFLYILAYSTNLLVNLKNHKIVICILITVILSSTYLFPNFAVQEKVRDIYNYLTLFFVYLIPVITLFLAIIRSKRDNYE